MCRDKVDEDGIQQLLCDSVSLHNDGAHQVHHVHLHLLVMAVTVEEEAQRKRHFDLKVIHCNFTPGVIMGPSGNWDHIYQSACFW